MFNVQATYGSKEAIDVYSVGKAEFLFQIKFKLYSGDS